MVEEVTAGPVAGSDDIAELLASPAGDEVWPEV